MKNHLSYFLKEVTDLFWYGDTRPIELYLGLQALVLGIVYFVNFCLGAENTSVEAVVSCGLLLTFVAACLIVSSVQGSTYYRNKANALGFLVSVLHVQSGWLDHRGDIWVLHGFCGIIFMVLWAKTHKDFAANVETRTIVGKVSDA